MLTLNVNQLKEARTLIRNEHMCFEMGSTITYNITIFGPHDTNAHALINVTIFSVKPSQLINVNHDFRLNSKKSTFLSHRSQKFDSSSSRSTSSKLFSKNTSRSDVSLQFGFKTGE